METLKALLDALTWYARRPWHRLWGHEWDCVSFLIAEITFPDPEYPITEHDCCECGLPIRYSRGPKKT